MQLKRKIKKIIFLVIILLILIITLIAGKSYSKYINQVQGQGTLKVANWSFVVNGETANITNIDLLETYKSETLKENTIAPGTKGSFNIVIDATGTEVGVQYTVKFEEETDKPANLKFMYDGNVVNSIKELEPLLQGQILVEDNQKIRTMQIQWNWDYETSEEQEQIRENDEKDTNDGKTLENYKFNVVIEGTQMAPTQ